MHAKPGDTVVAGQPLLTLHTDTPDRYDYALAALTGGIEVSPAGTEFSPRPRIRSWTASRQGLPRPAPGCPLAVGARGALLSGVLSTPRRPGAGEDEGDC